MAQPVNDKSPVNSLGITEQQLIWKRNAALTTERESWIGHYRDLSANILPRNGRFLTSDVNKGMPRINSIYDNTATLTQRVLSAGMMAGMTSPARPWFRLATGDKELMKAAPVKAWLADCTRIMFSIFASSNTYRTLHTLYAELGVFGTGASFMQPDFQDVIRHYPMTVGEYCIAADFRGTVDTIYRTIPMPVASIVRQFGRDNCSEKIKQAYDRGDYDGYHDVIHAVEPRLDRDVRQGNNPLHMPWKSIYFEKNGPKDSVLSRSGFKTFPGMVPRWDVVGGDVYGHSPMMDALGDIKQLQHEQKRKAQGIDYQTKPPLQIPSSMKGREVDQLPGGVSYYDAAGPAGGIRSLFEVKLDLNHLLADIGDVRERIRSAGYADLFLMISQGVISGMTATEVAERHEEKLLMLGPVLERLHDELLGPLVNNTFDRMMEAGIVPPPPPEMQGQNLDVEFVSMLAQAQRAVQTNSVDRFVIQLGTVAQIGKADVIDKFDSDTWADEYADMLGIDPKLIVPAKDVALVRNARAKQAQAQQQLEQTERMAKAGAAAGTIDMGDGTNAAQNLIQQFSGYGAGDMGTGA